MRIFIGCASSNDIPKKYREDCQKFLNKILRENDLVFGGDKKGLMELSYETAKKNGRTVISVIPKTYNHDLKINESDGEIIKDNIFGRTWGLIENSDASIFLPGGIGTIYEFFSLLESKRSHEFDKPIVIYNCHNYYRELIKLLDKIYKEKFTKEEVSDNYYIADNVEDVLNYLKKFNSD